MPGGSAPGPCDGAFDWLTTAPGSAGSPKTTANVRWPGAWPKPSAEWSGRRSSSPVPGAPTAACTPSTRWCTSTYRPKLSARLEPAALVRSCNSQLAPAIVVRAIEVAEPGFDARRSARSRRYRYLVLNAPVADPLLAPLSWHVTDALDLRAMAAGGGRPRR